MCCPQSRSALVRYLRSLLRCSADRMWQRSRRNWCGAQMESSTNEMRTSIAARPRLGQPGRDRFASRTQAHFQPTQGTRQDLISHYGLRPRGSTGMASGRSVSGTAISGGLAIAASTHCPLMRTTIFPTGVFPCCASILNPTSVPDTTTGAGSGTTSRA